MFVFLCFRLGLDCGLGGDFLHIGVVGCDIFARGCMLRVGLVVCLVDIFVRLVGGCGVPVDTG